MFADFLRQFFKPQPQPQPIPARAKKAGIVLAGVAVASLAAYQVSFTVPKEGLRHYPYQDVGGVWTVCVGHTGPDIVQGKYYTTDECNALFTSDMATKVDQPLSQCMHPPKALNSEIVATVRDFTFNVGGGAACSSTMMRLLNAGDIKGACEQFSRWVYVNGRIVQGLVNRRISERDLCMLGLNKLGN